ncbi:uncharacterized protein LOC135925376 [Gordionus sp. m RMFG-2023]|uniref:uncharacterized protein LOC135925376 n=1 Tax=Gordionus sp. m RMFG-2023 TaxID=3053472 RepID=UPI0031FE0ADC
MNIQEKTKHNKDCIFYGGYDYVFHKSRKKAIYYTCRRKCGGRAKLADTEFSITIKHSATCKPIQNYSQSLAGYSQGQSMNLPDQDDSQSLAGYSQGQSVNLPDQDSNCLRKDIYRYQHKVIYN